MDAKHRVAKLFREGGRPAYACWITLPGSHLARLVANSSPNIDAVIVDCEHGLIPLQGGASESVQVIAHASAKPPSTLVRIPAVDDGSRSWQIKLALDAGAHGVVCPMVSTAESARSIAAWSRFPPVGLRGFGSGYAHEAWPGVDRLGYVQVANEQAIVCVQIETKEGVDNVEDIAATPGIDMILIGPFDLALALGEPRPFPKPTASFEAVLQKILAATKKAGKKCGIVCLVPEHAKQRADEGFDFITCTSETTQITSGMAKAFSSLV